MYLTILALHHKYIDTVIHSQATENPRKPLKPHKPHASKGLELRPRPADAARGPLPHLAVLASSLEHRSYLSRVIVWTICSLQPARSNDVYDQRLYL